jgi:hypothetical protein
MCPNLSTMQRLPSHASEAEPQIRLSPAADPRRQGGLHKIIRPRRILVGEGEGWNDRYQDAGDAFVNARPRLVPILGSVPIIVSVRPHFLQDGLSFSDMAYSQRKIAPPGSKYRVPAAPDTTPRPRNNWPRPRGGLVRKFAFHFPPSAFDVPQTVNRRACLRRVSCRAGRR